MYDKLNVKCPRKCSVPESRDVEYRVVDHARYGHARVIIDIIISRKCRDSINISNTAANSSDCQHCL